MILPAISSYLVAQISVLIYPWKLLEKFIKSKILYFSRNFKLFCYSDFPFLYIHENFWKIYENNLSDILKKFMKNNSSDP